MGKTSRAKREAGAGAADPRTTSQRSPRRPSATNLSGGDSRTFLQRYRNVLVAGIAIVVVGLVGYGAYSAATASAYSCDALLEPPEVQTSPPLAGETEERLGFVVEDAGARHSAGTIRYKTCPPTSGAHRGDGALSRDFYGPRSVQVPNDWAHNLEHGYAVIAYAGDPGDEVLGRIRDAMDAAAPSDVAKQCGLRNKVIALRFDDMSRPFAVLAWDRALLMDTFDGVLAMAAAEEFQDGPQAPERAC